jgi:preprotein translocase subunit SecA
MSFINSILKAFVGDKSEKDVKALQGNLNKIKALESTLSNLSHDELRAKTVAFKEKIKQARAEKDAKINALLQEVESIEDIDKREDIYASIDALEKEAYEISEKTLNEILPEAFAVIKETAKRFKENTQITVTATPKDRELSATKSYITIVGDEANWANSWNAAGKEITWDMIHYDVQLIGGMVLHDGKIAEMQTGEGKT